ncbi:hypothetical protein HZC07_06040 [Candidatus Micrarchaeota archaeon]|nr:hypothetical protein [Candidatus Micrarchaeota archaeon]
MDRRIEQLIEQMQEGHVCNVTDEILNNDDVVESVRQRINSILPAALVTASRNGLVCCVVRVVDSKHAREEIKQQARGLIESAVNAASHCEAMSTMIGTNGLRDFVKREDIPPQLREKAQKIIENAETDFERERLDRFKRDIRNARIKITDVGSAIGLINEFVDSKVSWGRSTFFDRHTTGELFVAIDICERKDLEAIIPPLFGKVGELETVLRVRLLEIAIKFRYTSIRDQLVDRISRTTPNSFEADLFLESIEKHFGLEKMEELSKKPDISRKIKEKIEEKLRGSGSDLIVDNKSFSARPVAAKKEEIGGAGPKLRR